MDTAAYVILMWRSRSGHSLYNYVMKKYFSRTLNDPQSQHYFIVTDLLAFFTILSVVSIILETVPSLSQYQSVFTCIEWTTVVIFGIEYALRTWVAKPWYEYNFSFYGCIDLISIAPTLLGIGNLTFLKSARIVRIVRFLRIVRLAKIRHLRVKDVDHAASVLALNILIYIALLVCSLLVFGLTVHIFEPASSPFTSIPSGMWWAFRAFTGDQPVLGPTGLLGDTLYVLARFVGLILLGALVGITGNIMQHYFLGAPKRKTH